MKKFAAMTTFATALIFAAGAQSAEVGGDVETNVAVGAVIQTNSGIANENELHVGSVVGESTVMGDVTTNVAVGAIIQTNSGIANSNEATLGSVKN